MSRTNTTKNEKEEKMERLTLKIQDKEASIEALGNEITEASEMVETLDAHIAEATEIRQEGKAENKAALKDSRDAQAALAKAIAVLESFYKDSGAIEKEAWELVQTKKGPVELGSSPDTWGSSYTGAADPNEQPGGIVAMLKSTAADFAQMEADTEAQEYTDQKAFGEEMKSCAIEKARRAQEAKVKDAEKKRAEAKVTAYKAQLKNTENQLAAADQYWKDLGPACMDGDSSYETRKADREKEISALKEAQVILQDAFESPAEPEPSAALLAHRKFLAPAKRH
jgi:chromosome segregation ATPase